MRKLLGNGAAFLFWAYFIIFMFVAVPYFNWQYAQRHGFISWLFFGEIVASVQALGWPLYAISGSAEPETTRFADSDAHYAASKSACDRAIGILIKHDTDSIIGNPDADDVINYLDAAVIESEQVDEAYLNSVHPEFAIQYRDEYEASIRSLAKALRESDQSGVAVAAARFNRFCDWMAKRKDDLHFP